MKNTEENVDRVVGLVVWWFVIAVVAATFFLSGKASADFTNISESPGAHLPLVAEAPMTVLQEIKFEQMGVWIVAEKKEQKAKNHRRKLSAAIKAIIEG